MSAQPVLPVWVRSGKEGWGTLGAGPPGTEQRWRSAKVRAEQTLSSGVCAFAEAGIDVKSAYLTLRQLFPQPNISLYWRLSREPSAQPF